MFNFTLFFCFPVRPDFTDTLAIKGGRHPILDKISRDPPVPNNVVGFCFSSIMWYHKQEAHGPLRLAQIGAASCAVLFKGTCLEIVYTTLFFPFVGWHMAQSPTCFQRL